MSKITKQQLYDSLVFWQPEVVFAENGKRELVMEVDPFNNHINWSVKYYDNGYKYKQFLEDFNAATDYFVEED